MSNCSRFRPLLPLSAGGEMDAAGERALQGHLGGCAACRAELTELTQVISIGRDMSFGALGLPPGVRHTIASEAAAARRRTPVRAWPGIWAEALFRRPGLSAAAVAALLFAAVLLPIASRLGSLPPPAPAPAQAVRIDMRLENGAVRLAWSDGREEAYRVSKSSDPRGVEGAEVHAVRGNVWVDDAPDSSPIVFYRIE